jgi:hypothetical protein
MVYLEMLKPTSNTLLEAGLGKDVALIAVVDFTPGGFPYGFVVVT